jgi:aryl-alcohol dehydrogenase-like predicted oxidoreductase
MKYSKLHQTDLNVSEICFGTWPISGHGMGKVNEEDARKTIYRSVDLGVNFFDTADMYGFGYAEELLGKTLGSSQQDMVIATKVGLEWDHAGNLRNNLKADYVIRACEDSLKRLKVEKIDLYQLHWPDPNTPMKETMEALSLLVESGKVSYVGVSNFSIEQMAEASQYLPIVTNQVEYSLLDRIVENEIIPYAESEGMSILPYKVLGRGILTGKLKGVPRFEKGDWRSEEEIFQKDRLLQTLKLVEQLKPIATDYGCTVSQLVIAWSLRWKSVPSVIIGARRPEQIEDSCLGSGINLSSADVNYMNSLFSESVGAYTKEGIK